MQFNAQATEKKPVLRAPLDEKAFPFFGGDAYGDAFMTPEFARSCCKRRLRDDEFFDDLNYFMQAFITARCTRKIGTKSFSLAFQPFPADRVVRKLFPSQPDGECGSIDARNTSAFLRRPRPCSDQPQENLACGLRSGSPHRKHVR